MFSSLVRPVLATPLRQARLYSQAAQHATSPTSTLPYLVRRNTRGSIPVYTDIRNGGTRYLVQIRNVEGNADALADDLARTLFPAGSSEAERIQVQTVHQKHVVISGGRWKSDVIRWLAQRGF